MRGDLFFVHRETLRQPVEFLIDPGSLVGLTEERVLLTQAGQRFMAVLRERGDVHGLMFGRLETRCDSGTMGRWTDAVTARSSFEQFLYA